MIQQILYLDYQLFAKKYTNLIYFYPIFAINFRTKMGQKKVKVILKKVHKEDVKGYLRLSIREDNKTSIKNLKLPPIEFKYWNPLKQVVKSTFQQYKFYNEEILSALDELKTSNEVRVTTSKLLLIESCKDLIDKDYQKHSTKIRYKSILVSFENFIKFNYKKDDIPVNNLTPSFFDEYVKYITTQQIFGQNNIKLYISVIKTFLKKLEKSYDLNLTTNFYYKIIVLKKLPQKKKIIPKEDIFKILNTEVKNKKLEETRLIFLFQILVSGLRFSDVCTLRFKDFSIDYNNGLPEIRFVKFQRKTRKIINTLVNFKAIKLLANFLPTNRLNDEEKNRLHYYLNSGNLLNGIKSNNQDLDSIKETLAVDLENVIIKRHFFKNEISVSVKELIPMAENHTNALINKYKNQGLDDVKIDILISNDEHLIYFNSLIEVVKKRVKKKLEEKTLNEERLNLEFYKIIAKILKDCKTKRQLDFVFPLLNNDDFKDIIADDGFSNVNLNQQIMLKRTLDYFNVNLGKLCDALEINKISSHYARNLFGTLLIELKGIANVDMTSLKEAMGHSSVVQTESYIHNLSNEGKDNLGKLLSDNI
jgi:integrase